LTSSEAPLIRSCSPEADVIRGSEDHQKLKDWKFQSLSNVVILMPMYAEGMEAWSNSYSHAYPLKNAEKGQ